MDLIYWSVRSSSRMRGDVWGFRYLASFEHQFIRLNENLVQYPSNNISILPEDVNVCGKIVFKMHLRS